MKRCVVFCLVFIFLTASPSLAITVGIYPPSQDVTVGNTAEVELVISGLGLFSSPSLGAFDIDIGYDASLLSFSNATFGDPIFGDQLDLFGFGSLSGVGAGPGSVNLFEVSFDSPTDLDAFQLDSFILATLTFDTILQGSTPLTIDRLVLSDSSGLSLSAGTIQGNININSIPEPSTILLLGIGLVAVTGYRRRI